MAGKRTWTPAQDQRLRNLLKPARGGKGVTLAVAAEKMKRSRSSIANRWSHLKTRAKPAAPKPAKPKPARTKPAKRRKRAQKKLGTRGQGLPFRIVFVCGVEEAFSKEMDAVEWAKRLADFAAEA